MSLADLAPRTRVVISRVLVGVGIAGGATAVIAYAVAGDLGTFFGDFADDQLAGVLTAGTITWIALPRNPENGAVWVLAWVTFLLGLELAGGAIGFAISGLTFGDLESIVPSDLELGAAVAFFVPQTVWPNFLFFLTFGMILFPDGRLPSPRWRWVARVAGVALVLVVITSAWWSRPWSNSTYAPEDVTPVAVIAGLSVIVAGLAVFVSLGGLVVRWRRSTGAERQQYRWIVWGFTVFVVGSVISFAGLAQNILGPLTSVAIALAYGIAITKYRLYDVDVVISKTVLYGLLAAFIGGVYALVVVGIGSWIGAGTSSVPLSIAATAVVAVAFEPVRARVQRVANRLVYGRRATPYQVLADLTTRLASAESTEGLLERMVQRLADGTGAVRATLSLQGEDRPAAIWPNDAPDGPSDGEFSVPIVGSNTTLGSVSVLKARGETLTPTEQRLVEDLAGSAAMVLSKVSLDADLTARAEELRASRRRLVDAQEEERRRLEKDLHDGAQQQIVALKVKLGLAARFAEQEGSEHSGQLIEQMAAEAQEAIDEIRSLGRGIYPALLQTDGLTAALAAGAANAPVSVVIDAPGLRRYPMDVEAAAYFCISEAITNAVKYAGADVIEVRLRDGAGGLEFEVGDDGAGFDTSRRGDGSGIIGMRDRLEALGGSLSVVSAPGAGTTISGLIPASDAPAVSPESALPGETRV